MTTKQTTRTVKKQPNNNNAVTSNTPKVPRLTYRCDTDYNRYAVYKVPENLISNIETFLTELTGQDVSIFNLPCGDAETVLKTSRHLYLKSVN